MNDQLDAVAAPSERHLRKHLAGIDLEVFGRLPDIVWPSLRDPIDLEAFRDRCVGSLVTGAIGDGLGGPNEGRSAESIRIEFGPGGMREPKYPTFRWSDDTQLTMVVAESLIACDGTFVADDFVGRLVAWLPQARGIGRATREAVLALEAGEPWTEVGPRLNSSGNGAAMRMAPVGLVRALDPTPVGLLVDALRFSLPTHGGEVGLAGAVAMAAAVAYLAREGASGAVTFSPEDLMAFVVAACGPDRDGALADTAGSRRAGVASRTPCGDPAMAGPRAGRRVRRDVDGSIRARERASSVLRVPAEPR